jgi:shikimate dehydrogenase
MMLFGVTGHPVLHSRSPQVYRRLFASGGVDAIYTRIGARTADDALSLAQRMGMAGLNVTAPFKETMYELASSRDEWATRLGAANTVLVESGVVRAFNTDPAGVSRALTVRGLTPRGSRVVVLGAGGAARAAIAALVAAGADVVVTSRTSARAADAAARLGCRWAELSALPDELGAAAGLVSCLPDGIDPIDEQALAAPLWVLDANYARSTLSAKARRRGCLVLSGLDWLVGQAVASYVAFTGAPPVSLGPDDQSGAASAASSEPRRALALSGMMGAGKTRAGRDLARRLDRDFIDTDRLIAERSGHDIRWLFTNRSEEEFRRIEADTIARAVDGRPSVIALGGGSLEHEATRAHVQRRCRVVWLWASPASLAARTAQGAVRPLLDGHEPVARLTGLLAARTRTYASTADLVVDAERPVADVVDLAAFEVSRNEE